LNFINPSRTVYLHTKKNKYGFRQYIRIYISHLSINGIGLELCFRVEYPYPFYKR